jgi:hypothetical protein
MHPRAATLPLAASRISETDLAEARRAWLDVTGFRVGEKFKLQSSQGLFKAKCRDPLREDARLDEGRRSDIYPTEKYTTK